MDKLVQLLRIVLLFLVGLCGSEYICSKKRALSMSRARLSLAALLLFPYYKKFLHIANYKKCYLFP